MQGTLVVMVLKKCLCDVCVRVGKHPFVALKHLFIGSHTASTCIAVVQCVEQVQPSIPAFVLRAVLRAGWLREKERQKVLVVIEKGWW